MEAKDQAFHHKVRQGYLEIQRQNPGADHPSRRVAPCRGRSIRPYSALSERQGVGPLGTGGERPRESQRFPGQGLLAFRLREVRQERSLEVRHRRLFGGSCRPRRARRPKRDPSGVSSRLGAAAARLKESPTLENLNAYKRAIHDFLEQVINGAYSVQHIRTFTRKGRPAVSVWSVTIDERLEELAREVLSNVQDATAIAAKIDDIRGIILDYFR